MDVRGLLGTKEMKRGGRFVVRLADIALAVALIVYIGNLKGLPGVMAASAPIGLWFLETARLRRVMSRRDRDVEQHARALGLTPSVSDPRVHEGVGEHGRVRVWVEDPPMLHDSNGVLSVAFWALFIFGMGKAGVLALAGVLFGAVLLSVWTSRRATINVEFVTETGSLHRMEVHRSADVKEALAPMPRLGPAGKGALGFSESDDPAGRIGIAPRAGALSPPEREE